EGWAERRRAHLVIVVAPVKARVSRVCETRRASCEACLTRSPLGAPPWRLLATPRSAFGSFPETPSTSGDANVSSIGTLRSQECSCDVVKEIPSACRHELGLLPLPFAGEGWGGGDQHESCCTPPPCPSPVNGGGDVRAPRLLSRGQRRKEPRARTQPRLAR